MDTNGMTGAQHFSKLDASSGYWQTKFDEESLKLLCFKSKLSEFATETSKDPVLQKLKNCVLNGWPDKARQVDPACDACVENGNYQPSETLIPHEVPSTPWEKVGIDLFQLKNKDYLIVVDYTSKYFEEIALPNTLASTVVQHTKSIFARFGIPKTVVSDNGPQYSSHQYKANMRKSGTIKNSLKSGDDPCLALLALRSTPGTDNSPSPAFKLMNHHLQTPLPSIKTEKTSPTLLGSQKVKEYHDQHAKNLRPLKEGQSVRIRDGKSWHVKGKVMERVESSQGLMLLKQRKVQSFVEIEEIFLACRKDSICVMPLMMNWRYHLTL
ncbi:Transposon Ty3-G Gag-Pol poly [Paramuricea clavata]|uniref:Transposon Ty3-G Gag-Pol poly n=1 Tax=Paramuricea clavata TaxID=317549 RepID=A0A6S7GY81_PARCT|nr:Transposon Ty3-G Gag-Pol poly [Paramuricea clavata]